MVRILGLAAAVLGLGSAARADEAEDKAVALIQKLGGTVTRDDNAPGKPVVAVDLSCIVTFDLRPERVTDAGLKELAALTKLTTLDLSGCRQVTDAGVKELRQALPDCRIHR